MCTLFISLPVYDFINFEINLFHQTVFVHHQKIQGKIEILIEQKEILR